MIWQDSSNAILVMQRSAKYAASFLEIPESQTARTHMIRTMTPVLDVSICLYWVNAQN